MNPLISVIVPVYNVAAYLRECMDSIVNQTYSNLEIICVNDGSTDESPDILQEYEKKDSRVKVVHQKNGGLSAARNTGLKHASGEWVAYVDSDDALDVKAAEIWVNSISDDVELICFGVRLTDVHAASQETIERREKYLACKVQGKHEFNLELLKKMSVSVWNKIFRRSIIEQYGMEFPVGLYYEDCAFFAQYAPLVKKALLLEDKLYLYRQRESSITGQANYKDTGLHYIRIQHPIRAFYLKHGLMNSHSDIYGRFFENSYGAAKNILPERYKMYGCIVARYLLDAWGIEKIYPNAPVLRNLYKDTEPVEAVYGLIARCINRDAITPFSWWLYKFMLRLECCRIGLLKFFSFGDRKKNLKIKRQQLRELIAQTLR